MSGLRAGSAYLDVLPRLGAKFDSDVEKAVSGPMDNAGRKAGGILGGSLAKAVTAAVSIVAAKKALDFVKSSIESARESNKVGAQTEAVIRSTEGAANITAKAVDGLANSIARKTGIDDEQIASAENMLLTFTGIRNEVGKGNDIFDQATMAVTDMSVAMKTDLKSASILVGKALNDPAKGLTALTRVGVTFTDQQKEQIKTLVESGHKLEAQKIILGELRREFGGSAEAVATAGGRLAVVWDNIKESVGQKVIPALDAVQGMLADRLPGAAAFTFAAMDRLGGIVSGVAQGLHDVFTAANPPASLAVELGKILGLQEDSTAVVALAGAFENLNSHLVNVRDRAGELVTKIVDRLRPEIGNSTVDLRGLAEKGVQYVADTISLSLEWFDKLAAKLAENRDILIPLSAATVTFVTALLAIKNAQAAVDAVTTAINVLGPVIGSILAAVGGVAALVVAIVLAVAVAFVVAYLKVKPFHDAVDAVASFITDKAIVAFEYLRDLTSSVADAFSRAAGVIGDKLSSWAESARRAWDGIVNALRPLGRWIDENVISTISAAAGFFVALFERIRSVVEPIVRLVMNQLSIAAQLLAAVFEMIAPVVAGVLGGIAAMFSDFVTVALVVFETAWDVLRVVVETVFGGIRMIIESVLGIIRGIFQVAEGLIRGDFSKIWEGLDSIVRTPLEAAWTFITGLFDNIVGLIRDLPGRMAEAGAGLFDFMIDALKTALNAVIGLWNQLKIPSVEIGGWDPPGPGPDVPSFRTPEINFPDIPTIRDRGGSTLPGRSYLVGNVTELFAPGRGHVMPENELTAALASLAGEREGNNVYQLTSGPVTIHDQQDVQVAFHRLELLHGLPA